MLKSVIFIVLIFRINVMNLAHAQANAELKQVLSLTPNIEAGKKVFDMCSKCHGVEGWGSYDGDFPQLAGQHKTVIVKQLLDIRSGKRINQVMRPIILELSQSGDQAIVDVAAYIETLKMDPEPAVGEVDDDVLEKTGITYSIKCASCHGVNGEGIRDKFYPLLQGQNYEYLLRQLKNIQSGDRKNADWDMKKVIRQMPVNELEYLADFISRLEPEEHKIAPID